MALFGIRYYCFSLQVIKGQHIPLSSSYSGSTLPLFFLPFLTSCQLHLISYFGFPDCIPKGWPKVKSFSFPGNTVSFFPPRCTPASGSKFIPQFCTAPLYLLQEGVGYHIIFIFFKNAFLLHVLIVTCQPRWNMHFGRCVREVRARLQT